ncbi:MAG: PEP-CTERM sorting domain-containing protein [Rubrivivax sp.]|jgi:hypothetical protein|nr:PEP-CTERM sorting domain-containing protein [Rubrivivax sp.]
MRIAHPPVRRLALVLLAALPLAAQALDPTVETGLEVTGFVDFDGFGPLPPVSSQKQSVVTLPLPVSQIAVADSLPGSFDYLSSADIGLLELKVYGQLINNSANPIGDGETAALNVRSEVRDVLTFNSNIVGPYTITFELDVDGQVSGNGQAIANAFLDFGLFGGTHGTDSGGYSFGIVNDTLSVSRQVTGATAMMDFTAWLSFAVFRVDAGSSVTGALDNTATMRLVLPPGVELTGSASGTFGVPIPAIPEPATWAMMLAGAAWVAARSLRSQRRAWKPPGRASPQG